MTRFSYTLNPETNKVEKVINETYPDLDILERGIKRGRRVSTIKNGLLKAYQGQAEAPLIKVEEDWFSHQEKIQSLQEELETLKIKINEINEGTYSKSDSYGNSETLSAEDIEKEKEQTEKRIVEIEGEDKEIFENGQTKTIHSNGELDTETKARDDLESKYEWLKSYRGVKTTSVRPEPSKDVKIPKDDIKKLIAYERDRKVRNLEDTAADLAKSASLLMSFVTIIYEALPDNVKNGIPDNEKDFIEYAINKWIQTETRAKMQFSEEGQELIDKLYSREQRIAEIVAEQYSENSVNSGNQ